MHGCETITLVFGVDPASYLVSCQVLLLRIDDQEASQLETVLESCLVQQSLSILVVNLMDSNFRDIVQILLQTLLIIILNKVKAVHGCLSKFLGLKSISLDLFKCVLTAPVLKCLFINFDIQLLNPPERTFPILFDIFSIQGEARCGGIKSLFHFTQRGLAILQSSG